jgi:hypothetical protein
MNLKPHTKLDQLLNAIPSAVYVCSKLSIPVDGIENKTLQAICDEHELSLKKFMQASNDIDWEEDCKSS